MRTIDKNDREIALQYIAEYKEKLDKGLSPQWILIEACRFAEGWEIDVALPYVLDIEQMFEEGHLIKPEDAFYKAKTLLMFCEVGLKPA